MKVNPSKALSNVIPLKPYKDTYPVSLTTREDDYIIIFFSTYKDSCKIPYQDTDKALV